MPGVARFVLAALVLLAPTLSRAEISTVRVASGLDSPLFVTAAPGDAGRLFIVEQAGRIKVYDRNSGVVQQDPFLTISGLFTGREGGLLGLAFHPDFNTVGSAGEGKFFVNTTVPAIDTVITRYSVSATDPNRADAASGQPLLRFSQPAENHNGGWIGFNPMINPTDKQYLYIASGDGGDGNDSGSGHTPNIGNGQDITDNLLGKILRIDVDGDDFPADASRNYAVPGDNPFVGVSGDDEIWSYGLRNPWRASFDRGMGHLYIGDVGQGSREEINVQPVAGAGGENYGWRLREGTITTPSVGGPRPAGAIDPIHEYPRSDGRSVTGGYVYRGPIAELQGLYFFADFITSRIWSLRFDGSDPANFDGSNFTGLTDWTDTLRPDVGSISSIASFGEDAQGNLYIVDIGGEVFMVVPEPTSAAILLVAVTGLLVRARGPGKRRFG